MDTLLERLEGELIGRGLTTRASINHWTDLHADEVGPRRGAQVVARLWDADSWDAVSACTELLDRCACGRRWRIVRNSPTVHNVVIPVAGGCTGWRVLGVPPSWYNVRLRCQGSSDLAALLRREHGVSRDPAHVRMWSDSPEVHHVVVPLRPDLRRDMGSFELAALVSRAALRGFGTTSTRSRDHCPSQEPVWAHEFPGYGFDERTFDNPWELRTVALVIATTRDSPHLRSEIRDDLERIAPELPVRASIYTAWLWALVHAVSSVDT